MKSFFTTYPAGAPAPSDTDHREPSAPRARARIAVYDALSAAPRVEELHAPGPREYIEDLSARVYSLSQECGGSVPYTVIREVAENFIHANFAEPVVSIMDRGETIRFADQGPGIPDVEKAVRPGFTTASGEMKHYIRGVGSGLPIVREFLDVSGGCLTVEENLGSGAVVTISLSRTAEKPLTPPVSSSPAPSSPPLRDADVQHSLLDPVPPSVRLSTRQKHVLALVMENGFAGPSMVASELGVGVSTAYRDLASLEECGLIVAEEGGKRRLSGAGQSYLDSLMS